MTNKELNQQITKLHKEIIRCKSFSNFLDLIDTDFKKEFIRLHWADNSAEALNVKSLKIMFYLNRCYNFIPQHQFYYRIDIDNI